MSYSDACNELITAVQDQLLETKAQAHVLIAEAIPVDGNLSAKFRYVSVGVSIVSLDRDDLGVSIRNHEEDGDADICDDTVTSDDHAVSREELLRAEDRDGFQPFSEPREPQNQRFSCSVHDTTLNSSSDVEEHTITINVSTGVCDQLMSEFQKAKDHFFEQPNVADSCTEGHDAFEDSFISRLVSSGLDGEGYYVEEGTGLWVHDDGMQVRREAVFDLSNG